MSSSGFTFDDDFSEAGEGGIFRTGYVAGFSCKLFNRKIICHQRLGEGRFLGRSLDRLLGTLLTALDFDCLE